MKKTAGIYKITNTVNDKFYIGSSVNIKDRWRRHRDDLRGGRHGNPHLQSAWNLYGESSFVFETLLEVDDVYQLLDTEQQYLDDTDAVTLGYNLQPFAGKSRTGMKASVETLVKMSMVQMGKKLSPEHKEAIRQGLLNNGYKHSEETKAKITATKLERHKLKREEKCQMIG